jgi:hypothetical protein
MPTIRTAFLAAVGLAGLWLVFYPTFLSGFTRMQPEAGDCLLNNCFWEHSYRWAFDRDYPYDLWSPPYFYPTPYTLTYSETVLGTAPIYWLFRTWFSETVACQLWIILTYALNYIAMAVVLRWFGVNTLLTAAGAFVFAFGLIRVDHLTHQHMTVQYFSPFAVWYFWSFLREPSARRWALTIGLVTIQILASLHLGWFLGFGLAIFAIWTLCVEPGSWTRLREFVRRRPVATVIPLLAAALVLGLYARNFYRGTPSTRAFWEAAGYCPYPDAWVVGTPGSLWDDHLTYRHRDAFPEKSLFQGFTIYAVFAAAGWFALRHRFPGRGLVLAGLGTAGVMVVLSIRVGGDVTLWFLVHLTVPGANAFRAIARIAFVVYLFGMFGGLTGLQALINDRVGRPRTRTVLFAVIAGLMMLEQVRPFPESFDKREEFLDRVDALVPQLQGVDAAYVMYDETIPDYRHEIAAMWAAVRTRVPVINGFSGTQPPDHPGMGVRPSVEELVRFLGPTWHGRLAVIEWGPPATRRVYQVETGGRFWEIESLTTMRVPP